MTEAAPPQRFRHARLALAISMMVMGGCGIIYEYTLSVLGSNLMGSSHEQIFVIIGLMLFAMGLGAGLQRRVVKDLIDKFLLIELILGLLGGVSTILIYGAFVTLASYQLILYGFALALGALIGLEIPILIRINTEYHRTLRTNLSEVLSMDYIGSLLGALLFAYVLLSHVSLGRIAAALGLVNAGIAALGIVYFWPLVARKRLLVGATAVTGVVLTLAFLRADDWMASMEQKCFEDPIVYRETSPYQNLVLTERNGVINFYINGRLQFCSRDERIYHEHLVHVPLSLARSRENVLILGGGDGLALREVLRYPDVKQVTLVDLDPAVTELARTHPDLIRINEGALLDQRVDARAPGGVRPGESALVVRKTKLSRVYLDEREIPLAEVRVINLDADLFVRELGEAFDVAILDFPDPDTVDLAKLYSVDFYRALARRMTPAGVLSVQSTSPDRAALAFRCIGRTLGQAGFATWPYHAHVPSFGDWGWHLAWRGATETDMARRLDGLRELPESLEHLTPDLLRASFLFPRDWPPEESPRPNTKLRPVLVEYYRQGWR